MFPVCFVTYVPGLYPARTCRGPALAAGRVGSSTHKNEGRHAARHPLAPLSAERTCRRHAASASAREPWPCSIGSSC